MPVDTRHSQYKKWRPRWDTIRDVVEGEEEIKSEGKREKYLPRLPGMDDPGFDDYTPYVMRALFYGASSRTVEALRGAIFRRPPQVKAPDNDKSKAILKQITPTGESLDNFAKLVASEVITINRYGIRVDYPEEGAEEPRAYLCGYPAETIINWRTSVRRGRIVPTLIVIEECSEEPDPKDSFEVIEVKRWEVLFLNAENQFVSQRYVEIEEGETKTKKIVTDGEPIIPIVKGKPLDYIPFVIVSSAGLVWDIVKSPIADLVSVNLKHYLEAADLAHGRHFTALPTPWIAGYEDKGEMRIGSGVAWTFRKADTQVGMLEFTGAGLGNLQEGQGEKEQLMALLGAAILAPQKREAETAEALRIRNAGESSVLAIITTSISDGVTQALKWLYEWERMESKEVALRLNTDFYESRMSPEELTAYMAAWQQGVLSSESLAMLLVNGELLPPNTDPEEYTEYLEQQGSAALRGSPLNLDEKKPGEDPNNPDPNKPNPNDPKNQNKPGQNNTDKKPALPKDNYKKAA